LPLPGRLEEFRAALEEEIKAAQRDSSNVVFLISGRFIAAISGESRYEFETSAPLRVPPDTPGELTLEGRENPIAVTVVEIDELTVTLSCAQNLGRVLPNAKLKTNLTMLLRRLIERIEQKAEEHWPTAERLMNGGPVTGTPLAISGLNGLNSEQRNAVESALGRDLTFIWGPPGTGKTQIIGSIGRELFVRQRTLLLVSHTNVAVDEALHRIAELCDGSFAEGEIIRIGEPVKAELAKRDDLICHRIAAKRSDDLRQQKEALERERELKLACLRECERLVTVVEWAAEAANDLREFRDELAKLDELQATASTASKSALEAQAERSRWEARRRAATAAQLAVERRALAVRQHEEQAAARAEIGERLAALRQKIATERVQLELAEAAEPIRKRRGALPPTPQLIAAEHTAYESWQERTREFVARDNEMAQALELLRKVESMGKIRRMWHGLPDPEQQSQIGARCEEQSMAARVKMEQAQAVFHDAERRRRETEELDTALASYAGVPSLAEQERICSELHRTEDTLLDEAVTCGEKMREAAATQTSCDEILAGFWHDHQTRPEHLFQQVESFYERIKMLQIAVEEARVTSARLRNHLETQMRQLLVVLREVGLTDAEVASPGVMMHAIEAARTKAAAIEHATPRDQLVAQRRSLTARIAHMDGEVAAIEDQLTRVEHDVILSARVIATTLTRAFMRDVLQERRFDTVLCDEASMAPSRRFGLQRHFRSSLPSSSAIFSNCRPLCSPSTHWRSAGWVATFLRLVTCGPLTNREKRLRSLFRCVNNFACTRPSATRRMH
jgi:hypothetical protein